MEEFFNVRFETNKRNDGHVLDSYIMLYLEPIAQLVEHLTFNQGVSQVRTLLGSCRKDCFEVIHSNLGLTTVKGR